MSESSVPAWIPSPKFEEALLYAMRTHALQARKGSTIPYITHLLGVAALVIEDGGSEDEAIAALLHDAAEDQGREPRLRDIEDRFGAPVAVVVRECSESLELPKPPWETRKRDYVAGLGGASPGALRVSLADKLHNTRSMAADHTIVGDDLWSRFTVKDRGSHEGYYRALSAAFHAGGASEWLLGQYDRTLDELFPPAPQPRDNNVSTADVPTRPRRVESPPPVPPSRRVDTATTPAAGGQVNVPIFQDETELHRLGYNLTDLSRIGRWEVLSRTAVPALGLQAVVETIAGLIRVRRLRRGGAQRFERAIDEWEWDLSKLKMELYEGDFPWPTTTP